MVFWEDITMMRLKMLNFKSNSLEISKLNMKCLCEFCKAEISKGSYHVILNLHFRYYGYHAKTFNEKKKKNVIGTARLHFDCFDAMIKELDNLNDELKMLKVDLFTKMLGK